MSSTRVALFAGVVVTLVLTGCVAAPVEDPSRDRVVSFDASNAADETYVVTFSLTTTTEGFAVTYANNSTTRYPDASALEELPRSAVDQAMRVVPLGDDVRTFSFRLGPGEGIGNTVSSLPRDTIVVYTIANPELDEPMRGLGISTCGSGTSESNLDIQIDSDGAVDVSTTCRG